jgi:hypothetical protein
MKLSANTLAVLKNFSVINVNIVIEPGKVLRTLGPSRNIFAKADITDEFPRQVPIYDLTSFLSTVTLFDDVDIDFEEKFLVVKAGGATIKYYYSDPSIVQAAPNKEIVFNEELFSFKLSADDVNMITKVSAVLAAPTISVVSKNGSAVLTVSDPKNVTSHSYVKELGKCDKEFDARLRVEAFKLLPGDYVGVIAKKGTAGVVRWENQTTPLSYIMTVETDSKV